MRVARSGRVEVISKVEGTAVRRSLHRMVRPLASSVGFAVVVGFLTSGLCAVLAYHDPGDGTPEPASTLPFLILGLCGGYLVALGSFVYHRLKCSHERQA